MARMGTILEDAVRHTYPEFPLRSGVLSWEDYLPPLSATVRQLAERYDTSETGNNPSRVRRQMKIPPSPSARLTPSHPDAHV